MGSLERVAGMVIFWTPNSIFNTETRFLLAAHPIRFAPEPSLLFQSPLVHWKCLVHRAVNMRLSVNISSRHFRLSRQQHRLQRVQEFRKQPDGGLLSPLPLRA